MFFQGGRADRRGIEIIFFLRLINNGKNKGNDVSFEKDRVRLAAREKNFHRRKSFIE